MLSWTSVPVDILHLCFSYLDAADLLRAACVCQTWSRAASSDELWIKPLSARFRVAQHVLMEEYLQIQGLGSLQLKDIFLIACPPLQATEKQPKEHLRLRWFAGCPFHPKRHTLVTAPNIFRLVRCYWSYPHAFWSMSGVAPHRVVLDGRYGQTRPSHRSQRFGGSLDRLVRCTYWLLVGVTFLAHCTATYALALHPSASSSWHWVRPGLLALSAIPFGTLAAFSAPYLPMSIKSFIPPAALAYAGMHSLPQLLTEAPRKRFLFATFVSGASWVVAYLVAKSAPESRRIKQFQTFFISVMAFSAFVGVFAWRLALPSVALMVTDSVAGAFSDQLRTARYIDDM